MQMFKTYPQIALSKSLLRKGHIFPIYQNFNFEKYLMFLVKK